MINSNDLHRVGPMMSNEIEYRPSFILYILLTPKSTFQPKLQISFSESIG
jgi:hypothetical protein